MKAASFLGGLVVGTFTGWGLATAMVAKLALEAERNRRRFP